MSELTRTGHVEAISGSGTFIAAKHPLVARAGDLSWQEVALAPSHLDIEFPGSLEAATLPGVIDLASGYPDASLQPLGLLKRAMNEAARRPGSFGRSPSDGNASLRSFFAAELHPDAHHDVVITAGGQPALSLIFRSLALPGDVILMESPTYVGAIAAAHSAQLTPSPVPIDDDGISLEHLGAAVSATGARMLYLQPRHHNPTGARLAPHRRTALLAMARTHGLIIVEDDWLFDLDDPRSRTPPLAADDHDGHVIHIRSLTKSISPAMRIAAVASSGAIARRLKRNAGAENFFVSPLLQEVALNIVTRPAWQRHLNELRRALAIRRQTLTDALSETPHWSTPFAGGPLHLWLALPQGTNSDALRDAAMQQGVSVISGSHWHPGDKSHSFLRLSVTTASPPQIAEGAARLVQALEGLSES